MFYFNMLIENGLIKIINCLIYYCSFISDKRFNSLLFTNLIQCTIGNRPQLFVVIKKEAGGIQWYLLCGFAEILD